MSPSKPSTQPSGSLAASRGRLAVLTVPRWAAGQAVGAMTNLCLALTVRILTGAFVR
jgi:hypothetical protein